MSRDIFHQPRLLRAPSNLALNPARERAATASLGNLGQGLTTLKGKNFFLISNLKSTLRQSKATPPLSYHSMSWSQAPLQLSCRPLQALAAALRSPHSLLFSKLNSPSSPSLYSQQRGSTEAGPAETHIFDESSVFVLINLR